MWEPTQADKDSIAVMHFFKRLAPWVVPFMLGLYFRGYIARSLW